MAKKHALSLLLLLLVSCHEEKKEFTTHNISGRLCYQLTYDEEMGPWGTTVGMKVTFDVAWPDKGTVSDDAERELMFLCFGDSTAPNADTAMRQWLARPFFYENEEAREKKPMDTIDEGKDFCYVNLEGSCSVDSNLLNYVVTCESFFAGAAHGMYSCDNLTIDLENGRVIHLQDLVTDTALLCEAVAYAIQDLEVNSDVRECLFDEFRDAERMPLPRNFMIDSARNGITVFYGLYEITPYACGIQEVVLPIFWLSKHVPLTPYAKRMFGPGSCLED